MSFFLAQKKLPPSHQFPPLSSTPCPSAHTSTSPQKALQLRPELSQRPRMATPSRKTFAVIGVGLVSLLLLGSTWHVQRSSTGAFDSRDPPTGAS